jgi:uncharacterized protein (TIGR03437 family)
MTGTLQAKPGVRGTGFIMKISNDGSTVLYSTYFGGTLGSSSISGLATDGMGNLYVTGVTNSFDFPQNSGLPAVQFTSLNDFCSIFAEISAAGDKILYSGLILTDWNDLGAGYTEKIAVDAAANAYVIGNSPHNGGGFIAKVNAGGAGFGYFNYIPGSISVGALAVDAAGHAYIAGVNSSSSFPTTPGSLQPTISAGALDGLLAELNLAGSAFVWATYLPGGCGAVPQSIAVDAGGTVWLTGTAASNCTVPVNGWSTGPEFLFGVSAAGSQLAYSALYPYGTVAQAVAVDPLGVVHVGGSYGFVSAVSPGTPLPMEIFGLQNAFGGILTSQISPGEVIAIYGPGVGPASAVTAVPANGFYPASLGGVQVAINGVNAPLLYVSANQINAIAPKELPSNAAAAVQVMNGTMTSPSYPVWILPAAPAANPVVLNQDGTLNSLANPAHSGSIVTFWVTGWQSDFPLADGRVQSVANNDACLGGCQADGNVMYFHLTIGFLATVAYAGAAPGFPSGVTQFNIQLGQLSSPPPANGPLPFFLAVTSLSSVKIVGEGVYIVP